MIRKVFGSLCIDLGKLAFGGLILGSIMKGELNSSQILFFGILFALVAFLVGFIAYSKTKE